MAARTGLRAAFLLQSACARHGPKHNAMNESSNGVAAPRAFLLLAGDSADDDRSWAFIQAVRPVYELLGAPTNICWLNHHLSHRYAPEARAVAEEFLDQHLKR
jgi:uncharacterized protein with von Willebrand factor type A (vWA) domain